MRSWLPLGLLAAALVIGGSACGTTQSAEPSGDWMLAFQGDQDGEWATFAVGLDGGDAVRISGPDIPSEVPPVASPDGKSLILPDPSGALIVMRTDGSGRRRLDAVEAAWSPDGTRLAFVPRRGGISISDADGGHERELVDSASEPHWSPDGKSISYLDESLERTELRAVSVDDGHILPSPRLKVDFFGELAWSPDGRQIAFTSWSPNGRPSYVTVMNADGTEPTKLTSPAEFASAPLWSPDGRSIVYSQHNGLGGTELWEVRLEDRKARRLTELYPNGVNALGVGAAWIRGPVRAVERPKPMVLAQKDGAVLENPQPISNLAALDSLVAVVPPDRLYGTVWVLEPPLLLWDPIEGKLDRLSLTSCWGPTGVAPTPKRIGFTCLGGHAASVGSSVQAFAPDASRRATYFEGAYGDGVPHEALAGRIAGADQYLYFAERKLADSGDVVERKLWRVGPGGKTVIAKGADAGEPAAADGDRLAVERDDGGVAVLDSDGGVLGRISPGGGVISDTPTWDPYPPATVDLDGPDLVVLRDGVLQRYDSRSLKLVRSWRVPADAQLGGLAEGIAAYAASGAVHVVRLGDGAETVLPVRGGHITATDLTTAGLFYALNTQSVRYGYVQIEKNAPSRIVFVAWKSLVSRLSSSAPR